MFLRATGLNSRSAKVLAILLSATLGVLLATFSVFAWRKGSNTVKSPASVNLLPAGQTAASPASFGNTATDRVPLAGRFRARLGKRFLSRGKITTDAMGLLQRGREQEPVRISRSYNEAGETVTFVLGNGTTVFQWQDNGGAKVNGTPANVEQRKLIERLTLDSPDQFVLAQLRRTAYQKIAEGVRPEEFASDPNYTGPVWTLVQVLEADTTTGSRPLSTLRQYYLNQKTGLLDRILSREDGQTITAEFSEWVERNGETFPAVITWKSGASELMKLMISNISFPVRP